MAYTIENNYTGNNSTVLYSFTFPYLETTDIKVSLDQVDTTAYTLASATQVQFNTAPGTGVAIRIYRDTEIDNLRAEFFSGSAIRAQDLNEDFNQTLYNTQETEAAVANKWNKTDDTIDSTETWASNNTKVATTGAIDARVDAKLTSKVTDDLVAGTAVVITDNAPSTGKVTIGVDPQLETLAGMGSSEATALVALSAAEIATIDGVTSTTTELNILDGVTASTAEINKLDGLTASTTNLNLTASITASASELNTLDGISASTSELNLMDGVTSTTAELNYVDGVTSNVQTQLNNKQPLDADLTELSSMQTGAAAKLKLLTSDELDKIDDLTASTTELNILDGVTASTADINQIQGLAKQTTITDDDAKFPTSGAVVDYVGTQVSGINGVELIADDESFPNTIPAAGTVVSISDAGGLTVNSSGVSTNGDTLDNTTVTINGFPTELRGGEGSNANPYVIAAGTGLLLKSTGSSHTYTYHQVMIREADFVQLSDDINDFNSRYRIATSAPGSNNDEGDLYFDTNTNKMYVYDGSSWGQVTSTGDFKYLVLTETGTTNAAVYDGSKVSFDLKENTTGGSAASVTNAAQLMVSINGVVQKPNTGTNTSGLDGFVMTDADTIKFTAGVPTGASVFVIQSGSALSINVVGDGTVTEAKLNANAPTNDHVLTADSSAAGGFKWAAAQSFPVEADALFDNQTTAGQDILWDDSEGELCFRTGSSGSSAKALWQTYNSGTPLDRGYIDCDSNGNFQIGSTGTGADLWLNPGSTTDDINFMGNRGGTKTLAAFNGGGSCDLYYDNSKKFETTAAGATVTGTLTATLADNSVGLAQMASGTDGQIITYDASGDPVAVGPGTDGQVLTSTGAGSPPAFETISTTDTLSFRNLIINGAMGVDQRGDNATNTGNAFGGPDRWKWIGGGDATCNTRQGGATDIAGFANQYKVSVGTADASIGASQYAALQYNAEGYDVQKIEKGFSSAKQLTLSFWLKMTNVTGVFTVQLRDNDNTRHCCKQFTVSDANWNKYTLTFPADTTGKLGDDNGGALSVNFYWTAGTDYTSGTLASTWASVTTANICPGQTGNFIGSTSNILELTGVQLELGATATDFEHRTYGEELERCKRYYQIFWTGNGGGIATVANWGTAGAYGAVKWEKEMKATPTISVSSAGHFKHRCAGSDRTAGSITWSNTKNTSSRIGIEGYSGATDGQAAWIGTTSSSAKITLDAEVVI